MSNSCHVRHLKFAQMRPKFIATGNLIWASILGKPCKTYIANRLRSKRFGGLAKKQQIWGEDIFISVLGKGLRVVGRARGMVWHGVCFLYIGRFLEAARIKIMTLVPERQEAWPQNCRVGRQGFYLPPRGREVSDESM